ncbi:MAG: 3-keto-5-aminohexanoate cleavage protein [Rhodobacteraceae bacterium]|nr:3-keto-5-aminohexanoate cleavage protein [Paracoccaceae bacterium]
MSLPKIMVAPNGAYLTKSDHPAVPMTLPELVQTATKCFAAGAKGIHFHLRDENGQHLLDAGQYREAIAEISWAVPQMMVQITSESAGIYSPAEQRRTVLESGAKNASVSPVEIAREPDITITRRFYQDCIDNEITLQHILYHPSDLDILLKFLGASEIRNSGHQLLYVLGRRTNTAIKTSALLGQFITKSAIQLKTPDWAVCAFGASETDSLLLAHRLGGKIRVGFENSVLTSNGSVAPDNAARVSEVVKLTS